MQVGLGVCCLDGVFEAYNVIGNQVDNGMIMCLPDPLCHKWLKQI